jgi:hypothetical protein
LPELKGNETENIAPEVSNFEKTVLISDSVPLLVNLVYLGIM